MPGASPSAATGAGTQTFVYSPNIIAHVATADGNEVVLWNDILRGQVVRRVDSVSSLSLQLNNKRGRYTGKLSRMDRIVVFASRLQYMQVFSGYLDEVPVLDLFPDVCTITATCTLKRLL